MQRDYTIVFVILLMLTLKFSAFSQIQCIHGNQAYQQAELHAYSDVIVAGGTSIYSWDAGKNQYRCANVVLIPDLAEIPNGSNIDTAQLHGYGNNGQPSDNLYKWDEQYVMDGPNSFDQIKMFVSPLSEFPMHYASAIDGAATSCNYGLCPAEISGEVSTLAYPNFSPGIGNYELWTGDELVEAGDIKGTGVIQKVSQQQTGYSGHNSYCVQTYGQGWRLPTDMEFGHTNDQEGIGNGFDIAYQGTQSCYLWTSSLFITFAVKRWPVHNVTGEWENCAGFLYTQNYVRCVYQGVTEQVSVPKHISNKDCIIYPNPAISKLTISVDNTVFYGILCNASGQYLKTIDLKNESTIDIVAYPAGLYFINLYSQNNQVVQTMKIVKL